MNYFTKIIILGFSIFINFQSFSQCATCKAAAETSLENGNSSIASGINIGVLYMLFILFFIFGLVMFLFWKHRHADGHISK